MSPPLLETRDLCVCFDVWTGLLGTGRASVRAVDGVSLRIERGMALGLVGESGCGKSTLGRAVVGLERATSGTIFIDGKNTAELTPPERRAMRRRVQMIFQDPYASLNPRMTVGRTIAEPLRLHGLRQGAAVAERVNELLSMVDLPASAADRFPHEFSGGQRQRIGIARALACEPDLIICDEPVSALDVSIQAQVLHLLRRLQKSLGVAYLFIGHELGVVRAISDEIAVMYLGRIVEQAPAAKLFGNASHAYTRALISAAPIPDPVLERQRRRVILEGDPPNPITPPAGCAFSPRCPVALDLCQRDPPSRETVGPGHSVSCWRSDEVPQLMPSATAVAAENA